MTAKIPGRSASSLDPRRNAFRSDLAARSLEGTVSAERYVDGEPATVVRSTSPVRKVPDPAHGLETEAQFGEAVTIYDEAGGWSWVQLARDNYVGYLPASTLRRGATVPTHKVHTLGTFIYVAPDIKSSPLMHVPMNSPVRVRGGDDRFVELEGGGFVISRHLTTLERNARDFVDIAERFVGVPYLWGGRTRIGIDCSGLVQTSLQAAGMFAPRDSDMQQAELGDSIAVTSELDGLQRGDLVFWKGHVGIMIDGILMVHANAHHMMVAIEPLPEAARRIAKTGSQILSVKRLPLVPQSLTLPVAEI